MDAIDDFQEIEGILAAIGGFAWHTESPEFKYRYHAFTFFLLYSSLQLVRL